MSSSSIISAGHKSNAPRRFVDANSALCNHTPSSTCHLAPSRPRCGYAPEGRAEPGFHPLPDHMEGTTPLEWAINYAYPHAPARAISTVHELMNSVRQRYWEPSSLASSRNWRSTMSVPHADGK